MKNSILTFSKFCFAILFVLETVATSVVGQDVSPVSSEIKKSLRLITIEQPSKAIESLQTLANANPTDASVVYYLGYAQLKKGDLDKALATFDKGTKLNEKEALNYVGKGYVSLLKGKAAEAKTLFDKATEMTKSKNEDVLNGVGEALLSTKTNLNEALELLLKSKSRNAKKEETLILLGDAYLQQNDGGKAVSSYEDAALLDPKDGNPHYKIGMVFNRAKNTTASVEAFKKAVAVDPQFGPAYKELGEIYYSQSNGSEAVKAQESYLAITENSEPGKLQLAFYLFMDKQYEKANKMFEVITKRADITPIAFRFWAVSLKELKQLEKSKTEFEQYFSKVKKEEIQAIDYLLYAETLLDAKQDSLAIMNLDLCLKLDSTQATVWQKKAETEYKNKKYADAAKSYTKLMSLRPKPLSMDYYNVGKSYYYSDQMIEADTAFSTLVRLQPTMTVGYVWEAKIKSTQDPDSQKGLAKPYFEKVIELGSADPSRNKVDLIEAYSYMASYTYNINHDIKGTIAYYEKILTLKPEDKAVQENINLLKKMLQK